MGNTTSVFYHDYEEDASTMSRFNDALRKAYNDEYGAGEDDDR